MEATLTTRGLASTAVILIVYAWVFDEIAVLALGGSITAFLIVRVAVSVLSFHGTAASCTISRTAEREVVRQGSPVRVTSVVSCTVPDGISARVCDIIPAGGDLQSGPIETEFLSPGTHSSVLHYVMALFSSGKARFQGISITCTDPFLSWRVTRQGDTFLFPEFAVDPVSAFTRKATGGEEGDTERSKPGLMKGFGIHAFRDYQSGDDPRIIDWKLTAKYSRLFVREYSGVLGRPPLHILDVPDGVEDPRAVGLDRLIGAVMESLAASSRDYHVASLLVISGPNVLRFAPLERDVYRLRRDVAALKAGSQLVHSYRVLGVAQARAMVQSLSQHALKETGIRGEGKFFASLLNATSLVTPWIRPMAFESAVMRAYVILGVKDVILFTPLLGDSSHVRQVIAGALVRGSKVHLVVPKEQAGVKAAEWITALGATTVEVVR
ncbi:MAG: DUF58 domain-containing protein [Methanomicrobiales archaeon]|nr:DUF58 domain-containing protein [Methanomicrobiales archaeon]